MVSPLPLINPVPERLRRRGCSELRLEWVALGMLDRVDRDVDVELGPEQMARGRSLDPQNRLHGRLPEPRELVEGRNSSRPSSSSQKPCCEMFVISSSEMAAPGIPNLLLVI
jgi:hypothetical protein